ncbi:MAG TPA: hypothetical protein VFG35_20875, partial [Actinoplanes sp.]|nr:hypothetical protein [Actinoplanes sp.]
MADSRFSRRLKGLLTAALVALGAGGLAVVIGGGSASAATVGAGSYAETLPAGRSLPTGCGSISTNPRQYVTGAAPAGPVPTNDWWSSLLYKRTDCQFSTPLFAGPAAYQPGPGGMGLSYQTDAAISGSATGTGEYHFPYAEHVRVGIDGLTATQALVDGWSDWTVSTSLTGGGRTLRATIGRGLPLSYYQVTGGDAVLTITGPPTAWSNSGNRIGFSIG